MGDQSSKTIIKIHDFVRMIGSELFGVQSRAKV